MNCISSLIKLIKIIENKLGTKILNLASGSKMLCDGFSATKGSDYIEDNCDTLVVSMRRIKRLLNNINQITGYNDRTLTSAMQRLCDGYKEGAPLYSFGVLSDIHIQYGVSVDNGVTRYNGMEDFQRALNYFQNNSDAKFVCICGDLVSYATEAHMLDYKNIVNQFTIPIYECAGNHDSYDYINDVVTARSLKEEMFDRWFNATGKELYYVVEYGSDIFIFLGLYSDNPDRLFTEEELKWFENTLEQYKNQRCFIFEHVQNPADNCSDPSHIYSPILNGARGKEFLKILKSYKNTIWFHGHTHVTFGEEDYPIGEEQGYRSVHIPSLVSPRFYNKKENYLIDFYYDEYGNKIYGSVLSEGYLVDVYPNKIVLKGINFAAGSSKVEVAPFEDEVYALDTTLIRYKLIASIECDIKQDDTVFYSYDPDNFLKTMLTVSVKWDNDTQDILSDDEYTVVVDRDKFNNYTYGDKFDAVFYIMYKGYQVFDTVNITKGCTNQISISVDVNGDIYNTYGYKAGYRINSSGSEVVYSDCCITGFIPAVLNDTLRFKRCKLGDGSLDRLFFYDKNKSLIGYVTPSKRASIKWDWDFDSDGNLTRIYLNAPAEEGLDITDVAYVRISTAKIDEYSVVARNENL